VDTARRILDEDHYGLDKVKERIIEYIAVAKLTGKVNGQIICFVGPPGVGKTSVSASIARALGRKFVRMSLGGIRDEAEIRGHRRTYIGAMPGRVINAMKQAGTANPVLLFDEIDKLAADNHGDPSAAMLEVLDSAQNFAFRDHFLEVPYDLSKVLFITTANNAAAIPRPLLDRMELIEVPSYLSNEKVEIAARHLVPRQMEKNGLTKGMMKLPKESVSAIINGYTREAGVRSLERKIASVCRKAACDIAKGKKRVIVTPKRVEEYLGAPQFSFEKAEPQPEVGVVNGLAWTSVGGETLEIEVAALAGSGQLQLTGQLGEVMQESAKAAITCIRERAEELGLRSDFYGKTDVHIHIPEGAVPKDGPSAGISLLTAVASALTGIPVRAGLAMTGEITLRGRVLPIGGLREKMLAAVRADIKTVLVPEKNRKDIMEVPKDITDELHIIYVKDVDEVLRNALVRMPQRTMVLPNAPVSVGAPA
ncbi:MAG: endopeptidase La, partial [Clostridia bacterium]|nr:endopeptidase La [Clostridia bacterium]